MDELWNKRREKLEQAVKDAVMELFGHMGCAAAFRLDLGSGLRVLAGPDDESWHPIETAPKNGSDFLCYQRGDTYGIGYWHPSRKRPTALDSVGGTFDPDYWMPLPATPAKGESQNG